MIKFQISLVYVCVNSQSDMSFVMVQNTTLTKGLNLLT